MASSLQSGTVIAITPGPGVAGAVVTVQEKNGLRSEFIAPLGTFQRGDEVTLKWAKRKRGAVTALGEREPHRQDADA